MKSICKADCENCGYGKNNGCKGCQSTGGCPFGKQCFIASYILKGSKENYEIFVKKLIDEINAMDIAGMPKINELFPINGAFINLEYTLMNNHKVKFLNDDEIYLSNQVECCFDDESSIRCIGIAANMNAILISEYGPNGIDPEIIVYKKR